MKEFLEEFIEFNSSVSDNIIKNDLEAAIDRLDEILKMPTDNIKTELTEYKNKLQKKLWKLQGLCPKCGSELQERDYSFCSPCGDK